MSQAWNLVTARLAHFSVLMIALLTAACASHTGPLSGTAPPPLAGDFADSVVAPQPRSRAELLAVNDAMRQFVRDRVSPTGTQQYKIRQLTSAVLHPGSLGVTYSDRMTLVASEAFERGTGNCLTLSMLFVALAREAGIDARFYEVNVVPEWTRAGDIVFATRHVNVGGNMRGGANYVMDFSPYLERRQVGRRRLSDDEALAQYYNNVGAELLASGNLPAAYAHFVYGIGLAPEVSYLWSNLSVAYSRNGQPDAAELALRQAIALDHDNTSALTNLARILEARGDREGADRLVRKVVAVQQNNPYYQFAIGERLLVEQRYAEALEQLQRAIALEADEALFYRRAAQAARRTNQLALAESYDAEARRLEARARGRGRAEPQLTGRNDQ